jgi:hypothetical protein
MLRLSLQTAHFLQSTASVQCILTQCRFRNMHLFKGELHLRRKSLAGQAADLLAQSDRLSGSAVRQVHKHAVCLPVDDTRRGAFRPQLACSTGFGASVTSSLCLAEA